MAFSFQTKYWRPLRASRSSGGEAIEGFVFWFFRERCARGRIQTRRNSRRARCVVDHTPRARPNSPVPRQNLAPCCHVRVELPAQPRPPCRRRRSRRWRGLVGKRGERGPRARLERADGSGGDEDQEREEAKRPVVVSVVAAPGGRSEKEDAGVVVCGPLPKLWQ